MLLSSTQEDTTFIYFLPSHPAPTDRHSLPLLFFFCHHLSYQQNSTLIMMILIISDQDWKPHQQTLKRKIKMKIEMPRNMYNKIMRKGRNYPIITNVFCNMVCLLLEAIIKN